MNANFSAMKKTMVAALFITTTFGGAVAHAAANTIESYTIQLKASVPSDDFHVIPVDSGWINQEQDMGYDISTSKLKVFDKQFQFKNTSGGIQATLSGNLNSAGKPQLSNGPDVIPLSVKFNNVALSKTAISVVSDADAKIGGRTSLIIAQDNDQPLTVNGDFTGSVGIIFEPAVAP
ncbi:CS1 type fimbrial major subunit [Enterobacter sp. Bisph1]|uniref:CS1 type fimbrial major subunit n=1 Tax=Enterobacter sp. Bisph1 TaxID=1274399 RepID=UPI000B243528|nr:CS1 type fimbrial major subunit [Enterobacter sp. Bisph1]